MDPRQLLETLAPELARFALLGLCLAVGIAALVTKRIAPIVVLAVFLGYLGFEFLLLREPAVIVPIAFVAGYMLVVYPFIATRSYRLSASIVRDPPNEEAARLLERPFMVSESRNLEAAGFRSAGEAFYWCEGEKQARRYFLDDTGTVLATVVVDHKDRVGVIFKSGSNGRILETLSWLSLQSWPLRPGVTRFYHHFCAVPDGLLKLHREHVAELGFGSLVPFRADGIIDTERDADTADYEYAVERGYLARLEDGGYRLRVWGYYRVLWMALLHHRMHRSCRLG